MNNSLDEQYISETFKGILHSSGTELPTEGQADIYDGNGNKTALKVGRSGKGLTVDSKLTVDLLDYPTEQSPTGKGVVIQPLPNKLSIVEKLPPEYLEDTNPSSAGTYTGYIKKLTVSSKGLVTEVEADNFEQQQIVLPSETFAKAYAECRYILEYQKGNNQGNNFTIVGHNVSSILWLNKGMYRVTFTNPMNTSNYCVMLTNGVVATSVGTITRSGSHENSICVGHKEPNFFEFWGWSDEEDSPENISSLNIVVFEV
jgi:hypothetical protein